MLNRDEMLNPPLRFPDEFVRHKVLDLIGDLALLGKQILGSVVATAPAMPCTLRSCRASCAINRIGKKLRLMRKWPRPRLRPQPVLASSACVTWPFRG